jgi:hypothetical protein
VLGLDQIVFYLAQIESTGASALTANLTPSLSIISKGILDVPFKA